MTRITGVAGALVAGAAIVLGVVSPALAAAGHPQTFSSSPEKFIRNAVYDWELWDEYPVPFYDEDNYCWQQVWTAHGWRWVDVCHGFAF